MKRLKSNGGKNTEELNKCPFCGEEAEIRGIKDFNEKVIMASVVCKNCEASTKSYASESVAIEAWNNRV